MTYLEYLIAHWREHGTKLLGVATLVVSSALSVPDLISPERIKYWLFANALLGGLTVKRGFTNTKAAE